jgi:hypothetical protein
MHYDMDDDVLCSLHLRKGWGTCEHLQPADEMLNFVTEGKVE